MIKLEKLEKGEFFEDAFLVSYRYNKTDNGGLMKFSHKELKLEESHENR